MQATRAAPGSSRSVVVPMTDVDKTQPPGDVQDHLAAAPGARAELAPELAASSLSDYLRAVLVRIRNGESGMLPVVGGLLLISILYQSLNSHFLTAENLVNLLI